MTDLPSLLSRVGEATGPDRKIDAEARVRSARRTLRLNGEIVETVR